jgi:predicted permease
MLALVATGVGTLIAVWATALVSAQIPIPLNTSVDQRVLLFTLAAAVVTTVLFGLVPAFHATRGDVAQALKSATVGHDARRSRLQSGFVIAQVALSLVLLCTAGLFLSSLREATQVNVGFDASRRVLAMSFDLGMQGYAPERSDAFVRELDARARTLPGVEQVAFTNVVPMGERNILTRPWLETRRPDGGVRFEERGDIETYLHTVTPSYFATLDLPLLRGRDFGAGDVAGDQRVAIVSDQFARTAWGRDSPIGQRVALGGADGQVVTVVGVARDAMLAGTGERARATLYLARSQNPGTVDLTLLVRARGDAAPFAAPLREVFKAMDASMPITGVQTLAQYRWDRLSEDRLGSGMLSIFGAIALLLASVGVYAVIAFSVAQRTREIGVRVALGAIQRQVVGLFVREGMRLTAYGLVIGLALAMALAKLLSAVFFGVSPTDVAALAAVSALLLGVSLLACWLPARRAARVDPMQALRSE